MAFCLGYAPRHSYHDPNDFPILRHDVYAPPSYKALADIQSYFEGAPSKESDATSPKVANVGKVAMTSGHSELFLIYCFFSETGSFI
jgi:hypothetical protein